MFVIEPLSSEHQHNKYWKSCFNAIFLMTKQRRRSYVDSNIGSSTWNRSEFIFNDETTLINIRRLNFHFQPNFNVETTLVHRRWINIILSTLFQRCFANVYTISMNVHRLSFNFQPNIRVEKTLMNVDD